MKQGERGILSQLNWLMNWMAEFSFEARYALMENTYYLLHSCLTKHIAIFCLHKM